MAKAAWAPHHRPALPGWFPKDKLFPVRPSCGEKASGRRRCPPQLCGLLDPHLWWAVRGGHDPLQTVFSCSPKSPRDTEWGGVRGTGGVPGGGGTLSVP